MMTRREKIRILQNSADFHNSFKFWREAHCASCRCKDFLVWSKSKLCVARQIKEALDERGERPRVFSKEPFERFALVWKSSTILHNCKFAQSGTEFERLTSCYASSRRAGRTRTLRNETCIECIGSSRTRTMRAYPQWRSRESGFFGEIAKFFLANLFGEPFRL